jgi:hypothetical protein
VTARDLPMGYRRKHPGILGGSTLGVQPQPGILLG